MNALPWLEASLLIPLFGAACVARSRSPESSRKWALVICGFTLMCTLGSWREFQNTDTANIVASERLLPQLFGRDIFEIDRLNAPLFPLVALLFFFTTSTTLRTKFQRFSFTWMLLSEALVLATFSCQEPGVVICLLALGTLPPYFELRARERPTRIYVAHMAAFVSLLVFGTTCVSLAGGHRIGSAWVVAPFVGAILIRSGIVPFHCWTTDLFEHATFGTALLTVTPIAGAYAAIRLVLPIAPDWVLHGVGLLSLFTAVYAGAMALFQRDARRFFCYLFLSHSALVLVGLEMATPIGLTGALYLWLSVGLALGGFGLTLRALEARYGRLSLQKYHGIYEHTPHLAICFLLTGLASVGFPGTLGFIATELVVDGAVEAYPIVGIAVVAAAALNGIAIVRAYFLLFTGQQHVSSVPLEIRMRERFAVLSLAAFILIGGLMPQPGISSRYLAAEQLLQQRAAILADSPQATDSAISASEREPRTQSR